jgi:hypothetical protein
MLQVTWAQLLSRILNRLKPFSDLKRLGPIMCLLLFDRLNSYKFTSLNTDFWIFDPFLRKCKPCKLFSALRLKFPGLLGEWLILGLRQGNLKGSLQYLVPQSGEVLREGVRITEACSRLNLGQSERWKEQGKQQTTMNEIQDISMVWMAGRGLKLTL